MQIQSEVTAALFQSSQSLSDVISQYDPSGLSDEDAKALVGEISDLGIGRGDDLTAALTDAGFDPKGLAEQAGVGRGEGPPPPPSGSGKGPESEEVQTLLSVVEDLRASTEENGTEADFTALLAEALEDVGFDTSNPIVDFRA